MPWLKKGYRDSDHRSGDSTFYSDGYTGVWAYCTRSRRADNEKPSRPRFVISMSIERRIPPTERLIVYSITRIDMSTVLSLFSIALLI